MESFVGLFVAFADSDATRGLGFFLGGGALVAIAFAYRLDAAQTIRSHRHVLLLWTTNACAAVIGTLFVWREASEPPWWPRWALHVLVVANLVALVVIFLRARGVRLSVLLHGGFQFYALLVTWLYAGMMVTNSYL